MNIIAASIKKGEFYQTLADNKSSPSDRKQYLIAVRNCYEQAIQTAYVFLPDTLLNSLLQDKSTFYERLKEYPAHTQSLIKNYISTFCERLCLSPSDAYTRVQYCFSPVIHQERRLYMPGQIEYHAKQLGSVFRFSGKNMPSSPYADPMNIIDGPFKLMYLNLLAKLVDINDQLAKLSDITPEELSEYVQRRNDYAERLEQDSIIYNEHQTFLDIKSGKIKAAVLPKMLPKPAPAPLWGYRASPTFSSSGPSTRPLGTAPTFFYPPAPSLSSSPPSQAPISSSSASLTSSLLSTSSLASPTLPTLFSPPPPPQTPTFLSGSIGGITISDINPGYYYESPELAQTLSIMINEHKALSVDNIPISLRGPIDNTSYGLKEVLDSYQQKEGIVLIPYNIGNQHWVGLVLEYTKDPANPGKTMLTKADYYDSLHSAKSVFPAADNILQSIAGRRFNFINDSKRCIKQTNGSDCGPCTIANLMAAIGYPEPSIIVQNRPDIVRRWHHLKVLDTDKSKSNQEFLIRLCQLQKTGRPTFEHSQIVPHSKINISIPIQRALLAIAVAMQNIPLNLYLEMVEAFKALKPSKDVLVDELDTTQLAQIRTVFTAPYFFNNPDGLKLKNFFFEGDDPQVSGKLKINFDYIKPLYEYLQMTLQDIHTRDAQLLAEHVRATTALTDSSSSSHSEGKTELKGGPT